MTTAIHLRFGYLGQHTPNHPFEQKDHLELEPEVDYNTHIDICNFKRMGYNICNNTPNLCTGNTYLPYNHIT